MRVIKNNEIDVNLWNELLENSSFASPFQTPEFYSFFNSFSTLNAVVYAVEQNNVLLSLCVVTIQKEKGIKEYFSKRAIIYGGPLVKNNENASLAMEMLIAEIDKELKNKVIYAEIRNLADYSIFNDIFCRYQWNPEPHLNFLLDCSSEKTVWEQMNNNRQRQIKKALKLGVQMQQASNISEVHEFYSILHDLYKNKIKKPLFGRDFFIKFYELNLGKILLVKYQGKIIGGIVAPVLKNKVIYEFYICGLDKDYKEASPSVMATYAAIQFGYENKLNYFDFMGAGKPDEDYGVRDFKAKFGGKQLQNNRFLKIYNKHLYSLGKTVIKLKSKFS